jgi:hypothetical protein
MKKPNNGACDHFRPTLWGFEWGACEVERTLSHNGSVLIRVKTPRRELEIWVTPTGLIKIDLKTKQEEATK